jgi:transcription elongation factor S-II
MIISNPDVFRNNIRIKINEKLNNENASKNLEIGIYNYSLKEANNRKVIKKWDNKFFVQIYIDHLKSILNNLNSNIIQEINNNNIKPHSIAFMTHQELNHEKWAHFIEAKSKRDKNKFEVDMAAATDTFTCRKCKGNKCTFMTLQTRSADEPSTIYVCCLNCNARWKTQ